MGRVTAQALIGEGIASLRLTSRTEANARALAEKFQAEVVPFASVVEAVASSDVVISSTASPEVLLTAEKLGPLVRRRADRALVVIDLAVPRDFEEAVGQLPGVFLHDLDDLEAVIARSRSERRQEVPRCRLIVEEETERFLSRHIYRRRLEPLVGRALQAVESWRKAEVSRTTERLPEEGRELVDKITRRVVQRLLGLAVSRLKELRNRGELSVEDMSLLQALLQEFIEVEEHEDAARRDAGQ